jgi:bifunctional DNA-binding transcriptional regulator/antitoxin component of YhaV-PrlF toxin-antitoxin module
MRNTITITSRGQTVIPAELRRKLGVGREGGVLSIAFNERTGQAVISKPLSVAELSERATRRIKPGTQPVTNIDEYYQAHRQVDL